PGLPSTTRSGRGLRQAETQRRPRCRPGSFRGLAISSSSPRTRSALLAGMGQRGLSRSVPPSKPHRLAGVDLLTSVNTPLDQQFGRAFGAGSDFDLVATPSALARNG